MSRTNKTISVIVPAYNIEGYLSDCLNSILNQDFSDFEIIVVDDGSTDNTPKVCDEYAKKYTKISVLHQKNAGLSSARNAGIKYAKGEYLAFIDGDDLVASNFLSRLYQAIEKTDSDIAICNILEFFGSVPTNTKTSEIKSESGSEATKKLLIRQENRDMIVCNKLYKKDVFKNIAFPVGVLHEDTLTTYKLLAAASKVANIEDELYFYRKRPGSIMDEQDLLERLKIKERAAKEAIIYFKNDEDLRKTAEITLLLARFAYLDNIASGKIKNKKLWQETINEINSARKSYSDNPHLTKKLKLYLGLLKTPVSYRTFRKIVHE